MQHRRTIIPSDHQSNQIAGCAAVCSRFITPSAHAPLLRCLPQKCEESAFCTRLRGNTSDAFVLLPETVAVDGPRVTATVQNVQDTNGTFYLVLTAYGDTLRLFVNEAAEKGRWEVPDVLLPGLEQREQVGPGRRDRESSLHPAQLSQTLPLLCPLCASSSRQSLQCESCLQHAVPLAAPQAWEVVKKSHTKLRLHMGSAEAELRTAPAQLEVSVGGSPVLVWNGGQQFIFEHQRERREDDPEGWWAENFKSHHDSKPKGPTAISFDLQFPGSRHLYGIPQHATDLALRPTMGPEGPISGAAPAAAPAPCRQPSAWPCAA